MHKILSILFLGFYVIIFGQSDTAQVVVSGRTNSGQTMTKPYVILISADGFRYDYAKKYNGKNILKYSVSGVSAIAMIPSFPSITFPNHWSLITGLYPAHHGLIDNYFYDYKKEKFYAMSSRENAEDGSWYGGVPLWSLAEKSGILSASMMWVGSASDAGGMRPTYFYHYHEKFSPNDKVDKVLNWLKLPEDQRPHFITLYFPEVDSAGHRFGPDSLETEKAVHLIDEAVGNLVEKVKELGLKNITAIHGRAEDSKDKFHFVVSRAVTQMPVFLRWLRGQFEKEQFNPKHNGVLYLKGGDLSEELAGLKAEIFPLNKYFEEEFFETKKVVYLSKGNFIS